MEDSDNIDVQIWDPNADAWVLSNPAQFLQPGKPDETEPPVQLPPPETYMDLREFPNEILLRIVWYLDPGSLGSLRTATKGTCLFPLMEFCVADLFDLGRKNDIYRMGGVFTQPELRMGPQATEEMVDAWIAYINKQRSIRGCKPMKFRGEGFAYPRLETYSEMLREEYQYDVEDSVHDYMFDIFVAQMTQQPITGINWTTYDKDGASRTAVLTKRDFDSGDRWLFNRPLPWWDASKSRALIANYEDERYAQKNAVTQDPWLLMMDERENVPARFRDYDDVTVPEWLFGDATAQEENVDNIDDTDNTENPEDTPEERQEMNDMMIAAWLRDEEDTINNYQRWTLGFP